MPLLDIAKPLYETFGAKYPTLSLIVVMLLFALAGGLFWWSLGKQWEKESLRANPVATAVEAQSESLGVASISVPTESRPIAPARPEDQVYEGLSEDDPPPVPVLEDKRQIHIEQNESPGSVAIVGDGATVLSGETSTIRSLEIHIELDLPTEATDANEKAQSLAFMSPVALFDSQGNRYRFVTDGRFLDWQIREDVHRLGAVYKPEDQSQFIGRQIGFLARMNKMGFDYRSFIEMVVRVPVVANRPAHLSAKTVLNGIPVLAYNVDAPAEHFTLTENAAILDIQEGFAKIEDLYISEVAKRVRER